MRFGDSGIDEVDWPGNWGIGEKGNRRVGDLD